MLAILQDGFFEGFAYCLVGVVLMLVTVFLATGIRIIPENQRVVVFRLGKCIGSKGPGIVTAIPVIDKVIVVELHPSYHYKINNLLTSDQRKISWVVSLVAEVLDPEKSILSVGNPEAAIYRILETELKKITESQPSDEIINQPHWIEDRLKDILKSATTSWGLAIKEFRVDDLHQRSDHLTVGEINIVCTNIERSLKFYREVLGFEFLESEDKAYHLRCGQTRFLLLPSAQQALVRQPYGQVPSVSFDLMVDDIAEYVKHLKANAVEFETEWQEGDEWVPILDPDGLVVEVIQISD